MLHKRRMLSKSVLIVDDDIDALIEMAEALDDGEASVYAAVGGEDALEMAHKYRPSFILMDYHLPGINGLDVVASMRLFLQESVFIMMSGDKDFCNYSTTEGTGAFGIVNKPLNMSHIKSFMNKQLRCSIEGSRSVHPNKVKRFPGGFGR